jgi:hypothetical protein
MIRPEALLIDRERPTQKKQCQRIEQVEIAAVRFSRLEQSQ